ncbi:MAG: Asp-tRNA(Asn)/Glu-tRNA(Gln) amidotransferase GatCAB subunit A [Bryobacterales bacterium]|nr:Asp-tRNA(Asn)/Glu-tRNA(Gln) amidotransferase GatCAB subunit A [Bryobacterales bacterium]
MTLRAAAAALRARQTCSVELTEACLAKIAERNPTLNAFLTVTEDLARERAKQADQELARGIDRGPLHGIPIALKDVFRTAGVRTTCGSKLFEDYVPEWDAAVTQRLNEVGAVLMGKTGLHELALGITSNNPHFGPVRNPWDPETIPGGSSGGSAAAVASGMAYMAMGTDTGGSIRIPAAFCGLVGLKPTFGRVSRYGVMPLDFSLDHMGPLTRSVADAAVTLQAIAGFDPRDDTSSRRPVGNYLPDENASLDGLRVGWPENGYFDRIAPETESAIRRMARTAEALGARVVPVRVPDLAAINTVARVILHGEASALMEPYLETKRHLFGADVLALFDQGRFLRAADYVNAQRLRRTMQQEFAKLWDRIDCLFTPTTPMAAPRIGDATVQLGDAVEDVRLASTRLVRGINLLGLPALSIPCGLDARGMPLGLQIVTRAFSEALLLRIGSALEAAAGFPTLPV